MSGKEPAQLCVFVASGGGATGIKPYMFIVPEWPLYLMFGALCVVYIYRFHQSNKVENPTNYSFLMKAFVCGVMTIVYFWAGQTSEYILIVRNYVRLGNLLLSTVFLFFAILEIWLKAKYK